MNLTKGTHHYAAEMEFYYQKPRPEAIKGIIKHFSEQGILAKAENRLLLASFLSELSRTGKLNLEKLISESNLENKDIRHMLAWSIHLSQLAKKDKQLEELLSKDDLTLRKQISLTPSNLSSWDIRSEKSVLNMYWAAFMASGNPSWLDAIIDLALVYGNGKNSAQSSNAAASLYEYAPRHPIVKKRVEERLKNASGPEKAILQTILSAK